MSAWEYPDHMRRPLFITAALNPSGLLDMHLAAKTEIPLKRSLQDNVTI